MASAILISPSGIHPPRLSFVLRMVGYALLGDWGRQRMIRSIFNGAEMPEDVTRFMTLVDKHFRYRTGAPPLFTDSELASLHMPVLSWPAPTMYCSTRRRRPHACSAWRRT